MEYSTLIPEKRTGKKIVLFMYSVFWREFNKKHEDMLISFLGN